MGKNSRKESKITGKEKKVDFQIVADIVETAYITPTNERTVIVVVTGDSDILPALAKVLLENRTVHVETCNCKGS